MDILPAPKGGMKKFYSYFAKNYTASKKGEMSVIFVVERDGTLTNFKVTKNASSANEAEVIKVLESGPKWIPGKTNNRIVRSTFILPITFK
ncbi:Gram-negative bacterial tonB protein [compost metagenome]